MGDDSRLGPFVADDSFLRRIDRKNRIRDGGLVTWEAFKPREDESALSFTYQDHSLKTDEGLRRYQTVKMLPSGDLPGACKLTFHDLTQSLAPPLPPRQEVDDGDPDYGHLHCVTDPPQSDIHMEQMAKLATRNGLVLPFVPKKKRRDQ
ncbi:MAG: hypothetical protein AMXMBFR13_10890 [Phycisphaerae bacterium]